ncbi:MgtC/SapB family protein [Novispirillum itersonii]|uniref:Protein MgtC n=1 Tax=Novispirillum itersonii TaxID=189 RepID=A0A7X0DMN1_NOVIT|nr:MgtC/SapB family protein [Novispirillum itersonii]MBB6209357.1 putative Mg2+ transporter-C (MgtC) family protein [Novispirillum itersonii]
MELLKAYWSVNEIATNILILMHLLGALAVGVAVGYERSYHGRAAGIRTYALVCVASCVLTVVNAYPGSWFGGLSNPPAYADPTRVMQGILTGIGFLGAGVIMKEGMSIRGLSTAASIWMTAAIGVVIGLGFYGAAIFAAIITVALMSGVRSLETALPHTTIMHLTLKFPRADAPETGALRALLESSGWEVSDWTFQLCEDGQRYQYEVVLNARSPAEPSRLVQALDGLTGLLEYRLSPTRN